MRIFSHFFQNFIFSLQNKEDTRVVPAEPRSQGEYGYMSSKGYPDLYSGKPNDIYPFVGSFVKDGTHQLPLFKGNPPEFLMESPDPYNDLLKQLQSQASKGDQTAVYDDCCACCGPGCAKGY